MKKMFLLFIIILTFIFTLPTFAQFGSSGLKVGLQGNFLYPRNDFDNDNGIKFAGLIRGFIRMDLVKGLQFELGVGEGIYAGLGTIISNNAPKAYYMTRIIPIDFRFVVSPWEREKYNPYFYAGFGALHWDKWYSEFTNIFKSPQTTEPTGWTGVVPAGAGIQLKLSEHFALDFQAGINYTFTDNLEQIKMNDNQDYYYTAGIGLFYFGPNPNADDDNDGLTNPDEKLLGTDPMNPDTDGDGLLDGAEVKTFKTNPLNPDTDGDGLKDGEEVMTYKTDPNKVDTDVDGLKDGEEAMKYKTDPLKADTDDDGLKDGEEAMKYKTDPLKADTDGDGLKDGDEVMKYKTDPLNPDTDKDGLKDGEEVIKYQTDPLNPDTDSGTINDGTEVKRGTNPLDASDDIPKIIKAEIGQAIVLEGITFKTGSAEILPVSEEILQKALNTLVYYKDMEVEIAGHTDNVGKKAYNKKLSEKRAESVKAWLVAKGINSKRITTKGYGLEKPIASNKTEEGRTKNRRIEFIRTK
jgi:outer membrane protein OmpA-like peptidoglycan-associated protein